MARTRTTKKLAQRVDLNYFKRPTRFNRAKLWLSVLLPLLALGWIAWRGFTRDARVYSSGRMSGAHAVLEQNCAVCHVEKAGGFSAKTENTACLACHDGPVHHENEVTAEIPTCAACHAEHRGRIDLDAASNQSCAECHGDLKVTGRVRAYSAHILSLEDGHPEFAVLRGSPRDPGTIQLNHAVHMKPIRRGPNGPLVQLECGDCHRPAGVNASWPYADPIYVTAKTSNLIRTYLINALRPTKSLKNRPLRQGVTIYEMASSQSDALPRDALPGPKPLTGRETMVPVRFAEACASCHLLTFDKRFHDGVPHDKPEVVHVFLVERFREYIGAHPSEVRVERDPKRDLTGKPIPAEMRVLTTAEWVMERTADAEELLWRKTCKQCHRLFFGEGASLPSVAPTAMRERWLEHAKFDHHAHRGFSCVSCHAQALTSTETSDILVPGIANCKTCHAPGPEHAESRCFECHTYHDWSKRKEVKASYTMPETQTSGR